MCNDFNDYMVVNSEIPNINPQNLILAEWLRKGITKNFQNYKVSHLNKGKFILIYCTSWISENSFRGIP